MSDHGVVEHFAARLGFSELKDAVGLGEGSAPLVSAEPLLIPFGFTGEFYLHLEWVSPHASFRDRAAAVAVSAARRDGCAGLHLAHPEARAREVLAHYALRAGMPSSSAAQPDPGWRSIDAEELHWRTGLATAAWDVFEQLDGRPPEVHAIAAEWTGYADALEQGYHRLASEGVAAWEPRIEATRSMPSSRAREGLVRLGLEPREGRAAALEGALLLLERDLVERGTTLVCTLGE